ncbi:MAG TPA: ABC transporter permease [Conexibacter sp.]|jgi:peptide/nickel transport system permease protein|nr:ABC transporter permease [Conexibacter sp.]
MASESVTNTMAAVPSPSSRRVAAGTSVWGWLARRLLTGVAVLWAVGTLVFIATQALPGDTSTIVLGSTATPQQIAALQQQFGLDRPLLEQYVLWLGHVVTFDFGDSLVAREPVTQLIGQRIGNSLVLVSLSVLISLPLSFLVGLLTAARRDRPLDHGVSTVSLVLASIPDFVKGLLLVLLFATTVFHVFPAVSLIPAGDSALSHPDELVLPVATLVLSVVPYLSRLFRASMIEVLDSEYIQVARLKGLPSRTVLLRHAAPNALVPAVQGAALTLAYLLGGIVLIEFLFGFPGLGAALSEAVNGRDLPVIQAIVLLFAGAYIVFNILADLATVYLTPRLRTELRS